MIVSKTQTDSATSLNPVMIRNGRGCYRSRITATGVKCSEEDLTPEQVERTFKTNIFGFLYLTWAALPHLNEGRPSSTPRLFRLANQATTL